MKWARWSRVSKTDDVLLLNRPKCLDGITMSLIYAWVIANRKEKAYMWCALYCMGGGKITATIHLDK